MSYAMITGASKGIGRSLATELAKKKTNVILIARNEGELLQLSSDLEQNYGVKALYRAIDLSVPGSAQQVFDWVRQQNISVQYLINNAGYGLSGHFSSYSLQEHLQLMQVNMNTVVELTYLFLPQLRQQPQAYIMNIASSAAYQAVPYMSLYAATKAFVLYFSRGLRHELRHSPVSVTCISPGPTATNFDARANLGPRALKAASKFHMQSGDVARMALKAMYARKPEVVIGVLNKLGAFFVWLLPKKLVEGTAAKIYE